MLSERWACRLGPAREKDQNVPTSGPLERVQPLHPLAAGYGTPLLNAGQVKPARNAGHASPKPTHSPQHQPDSGSRAYFLSWCCRGLTARPREPIYKGTVTA